MRSPRVNNHNVELIKGDWNSAFREELRSFPFGKHDDMVDASSRAHMVLTSTRMPMRITQSVVDRLALPMYAPLIAFDNGRVYRGGGCR